MTVYLDIPDNFPKNHPLRKRFEKLFQDAGLEVKDRYFTVSFIVSFLGSTLCFSQERTIYVRDFRVPQSIPKKGIMLDMLTGFILVKDEAGFIRHVSTSQYFNDHVLRDPLQSF